MDRDRRRKPWTTRSPWAAVLCTFLACGCQTVRTPEEKIAVSGVSTELKKTSMPPYVVEPPDLLTIEVLEALPFRNITGEYLVRPDGTVGLGWYGSVYVAGLTLDEVKEKIVLHLRQYLKDEVLGLYRQDSDTLKYIEVQPKDTNRVFVDVAEYNSKYYYVMGDVAVPGKNAITGNETVLDAINNSGGLIATAAPQNIRLVRPAPPGACCTQVLPVNFPAIVNNGDTTTNYQLMPGDRVVVFRDPIVRTTVFLERIAAPFFTVLNGMQVYSFGVRSAKSVNIPIGFFPPTTTTSSSRFPPTTGSSR